MIKKPQEREFARPERSRRVSIKGLTKAILVGVGAGVLIGTALIFPGVGFLYKELGKKKWEEANKRGILRSTIRRLEKQRLVSWTEKEGELVLCITESGKQKILHYVIDDLSIKKPKKWDGWWRMIIFDIPEHEKEAREFFRDKLKAMKFYRFQDSVFVHPYECKDEIDFLRHELGIERYVSYVLAKDIPNLSYERFK